MYLYQLFVDKGISHRKEESFVEYFRESGMSRKVYFFLCLLHDDMKAWVNDGGNLPEPMTVENGGE